MVGLHKPSSLRRLALALLATISVTGAALGQDPAVDQVAIDAALAAVENDATLTDAQRTTANSALEEATRSIALVASAQSELSELEALITNAPLELAANQREASARTRTPSLAR